MNQEASNAETSRAAHVSKRILVAEDDATTARLLGALLDGAGYQVAYATDGIVALDRIKEEAFDLVLLDVWMPRMNGLDLLAHLQGQPRRPRVVVMTSDDTPGTLLAAVKEQAYHYVTKPIQREEFLEIVRKALERQPTSRPIRVISAKPEWVELLVPCERDAADRIQSFMTRLKADLDEEVRESVGRVFRELLLNAIEWGGRLDPQRDVRVAYVRAKRMLLYRIADPGPGFKLDEIDHAAINNPPDEPFSHSLVREERGLRPGGFGIMLSKALVDELVYNEAQNEVVFVKYLEPSGPSTEET